MPLQTSGYESEHSSIQGTVSDPSNFVMADGSEVVSTSSGGSEVTTPTGTVVGEGPHEPKEEDWAVQRKKASRGEAKVSLGFV